MTPEIVLAVLIGIVGWATLIVDVILATKHKDQRWLRLPRGLAAGWLGTVFLFNAAGVMVDPTSRVGLPPLIGRSATILLLTTILSGAIYSLRNHTLP